MILHQAPKGLSKIFLKATVGYSPAEDNEAFTKDSDALPEDSNDELQFDWVIQIESDDECGDEELEAWAHSAIKADRDSQQMGCSTRSVLEL